MINIVKTVPRTKRRKLFYYEIINSCTISVPDVPAPKINADVFSGVSTEFIRSLADVASEISDCYPLANHFGRLANNEAEELQDQLDNGDSFTNKQKKATRRLIEELESDPADDAGWRAWIRTSDPDTLPTFIALINEWLESSIDWNHSDHFSKGWSGQDMAKNFFESEDREVLDALQIEIIEGDCPGSDYFAAELGLDITEANKIARRLKLDYRFKAEGTK